MTPSPRRHDAPYPTANLTMGDLLGHIDRRCDRIEVKVDALAERVETRLDEKAVHLGAVESRLGNLEGRDETEGRKRARWGSRFWGLVVIAVTPLLSLAAVLAANLITGS